MDITALILGGIVGACLYYLQKEWTGWPRQYRSVPMNERRLGESDEPQKIDPRG